jgi:hypothetical protein
MLQGRCWTIQEEVTHHTCQEATPVLLLRAGIEDLQCYVRKDFPVMLGMQWHCGMEARHGSAP